MEMIDAKSAAQNVMEFNTESHVDDVGVVLMAVEALSMLGHGEVTVPVLLENRDDFVESLSELEYTVEEIDLEEENEEVNETDITILVVKWLNEKGTPEHKLATH